MTHFVDIIDGMDDATAQGFSNLAIAFINIVGGVVGLTNYAVSQHGTPNNTVDVAVGRAYIPDPANDMVYSTRLTSPGGNVTIAANSSGNPRIDSIVAYIDLSASPDPTASNVVKFFDVQGTPAGSPVAPTNSQILAQIGVNNPYIILALVAVANGFSSISNANITDQRTFAIIGTGDTVFQSALDNFVSSGISIPTSGTLASTATSGVLYIAGQKVLVSSDGGHTYTANKDTYVDVDTSGTYHYSAVNNGNTAPSVTANSVRVAKVVTGASAVTSVVQSGFDNAATPNRIYPTTPAVTHDGVETIRNKTLATGTKIALGSDAQGDIYYLDSSGNLARLVAGTAGQMLQTLGSGQNPQWAFVNGAEGALINGKITTAVASSNLTVAIKTLAGNDPSVTDPVYVRVGDTIRTITAALSVTKNAGTNWFNSGAAETATLEIDYFVYIGYNATDGVTLGFARFPSAHTYADFSVTSTNDRYAAISNITTAASTDVYENIGRFNAILSATASFNWSIANSLIINKPTYNTRWLTWAPTLVGFSAAPTNTAYRYMIVNNQCFLQFTQGTNGTSNTTGFTAKAPITPATVTNGQWLEWAYAVDNGAVVASPADVLIASNSLTITLEKTPGTAASWTNTSGKRASFNTSYEL